MKKLLFVVVDALASQEFIPAMRRGELPTFRRLAEMGSIADESISVFPSITPAATASLVTGKYPANHQVVGNFWYDREQSEVAYYGDDMWVVLRKGLKDFLEDFLVNLNEHRLRAPTIFEFAEDGGRHAACLNYLWFRGRREQQLTLPTSLSLLSGVPSKRTIHGPRTLCLGDLAAHTDASIEDIEPPSQGFFHRFGFDDATTAKLLTDLFTEDFVPDLTVAYFPDNDFASHDVGPSNAITTVAEVDAYLGKLFGSRGSVAEFLQEFAVIVTGDHSQSEMCDDESQHAIRLDELLSEFAVAKVGTTWNSDDDYMICPNMRAAQIYCRTAITSPTDPLIRRLLSDPRVDQVFWKGHLDDASTPAFFVTSRDRGTLNFSHVESVERGTFQDVYGNVWQADGSLDVVDAHVNGDGCVQYRDYPNALERIAGAFCATSGDLWVTAYPGYEFATAETSVHHGGSHGSLHALDSCSPLIAAGLPSGVSIPDSPRSIDVFDVCSRVLGLKASSRSDRSTDLARTAD